MELVCLRSSTMMELYSRIQRGMKVDPYELWNRIISVNLVQIELLKAHGYTTGTASSIRREFRSQFSNWVRMWPFCRPLRILQTSREIACSLTLHFDSVYCGSEWTAGLLTWLDESWPIIIITRNSSLRHGGCSNVSFVRSFFYPSLVLFFFF